ncbi:MAG TPA: hypothetical protein VJX67_18375 [Blastocatellia bacterium]|nr:hypothetical protein [Blastocatellia bacterium]
MKIFSFLNAHNHYWGVPHPRAADNTLVQTCYECGAERKVKIELRPEHGFQGPAEGHIKAA